MGEGPRSATSRSSTTSSANSTRLRPLAADLPFDFDCGFAGYLGYELKAECGAAATHTSPHPDAAFILADRLIAFDHEEEHTYLLCLHEPGDEEAAEAWLSATASTPGGSRAAPLRPSATGEGSPEPPRCCSRPRVPSTRPSPPPAPGPFPHAVPGRHRHLRDHLRARRQLRALPDQLDRHRGRRRPPRSLYRAAPRQPGARSPPTCASATSPCSAPRPSASSASTARAGRRRSRSRARAPRGASRRRGHAAGRAPARRREEPGREPDDRRPAAQRPRLRLRGRQRRGAEPDGGRELRDRAPAGLDRARAAAARRRAARLPSAPASRPAR